MERRVLRWAAGRARPSVLYHATTPRKLDRYGVTQRILAPVRGFDTIEAARAWAREKQRIIILRIEVRPELTHLLPDHHRLLEGAAWWTSDEPCNWSEVE